MAEQKTAEQILEAVRALRPGVNVSLADGITVRVRDVAFGDMEEFATGLSTVIPTIISIVSDVMTKDIATENVTLEQVKEDPSILEKVIRRPQVIAQMTPYILKHLSGLIESCVEPVGVFKSLPHDMAAPIISEWFALNLTGEKLGNWITAFEGVGEVAKDLLPTSELQ